MRPSTFLLGLFLCMFLLGASMVILDHYWPYQGQPTIVLPPKENP